jgi:hypothetical protein
MCKQDKVSATTAKIFNTIWDEAVQQDAVSDDVLHISKEALRELIQTFVQSAVDGKQFFTHNRVQPLVDAAHIFIARCEAGEVRSKRTYTQFKEALAIFYGTQETEEG